MSSSYVINPPSPNVNTNGTFNVIYTTDSIPLLDTATYNLVNTANNNTLKSITNIPYESNSFVSEYSTLSGRLPVVVFGLPNKSVLIDFNKYPYNVVYNESGTKLLENTAIQNNLLFSMASDGSYAYGMTAGFTLNRYYLDGSYVQGSTVSIGIWCYGSDYCPIDDRIYAVRNAGGCEIYKINKTTGATELFVTLTECQDGYGLGGLVFNADYTYMYIMHRNPGNIYYIERANPANRGILASVDGQSATITYNRELNTLYSCANSSRIIYAIKLITPSTCEPRRTIFTLGTGEATYAINYSNVTNYFYIATTLFKVYVIKSPTLQFLSVSNQYLSSGSNTLQIKRNNVNFGSTISITGVTDSSFAYNQVLDSYSLNPPVPKVNNGGGFNLSYYSKSISMGDTGNYNLVNTANNNTIKTVSTTTYSTVTFSFTLTATSTRFIYGLNNTNFMIDGGSIYNESGTSLLNPVNSLYADTYGLTTDDIYIYGFTGDGYMNKFDLDGIFISNIANVGLWFYGAAYCAVDDFIYAGHISTNIIYKINKTTGAKTAFVTVTELTLPDACGEITFNGDYTYMYIMDYQTGKIFYIERANPNNRGILTTVERSGRSLTCNRANNIIYASNWATSDIYSIQLLTPTTCETKRTIFNIDSTYYTLRVNYNNLTGFLYIISNAQGGVSNICKIYILKPNAITFSNIPTNSLANGANTLQIKRGTVNFGDPITVNATCFLEGTRILCLTEDNEEKYIEIENIRKGTLVKTHSHGFKPVHAIGKGKLFNPSKDTPTADRLYVLKKEKCSDLTDDLYITGHHSVLVRTITDKQREDIINEMGKIYGTGERFRLPACLDERFEPYTDYGMKTIWHLALEHENIYKNYGVFANGLLVETCSIRYLTELSNLELQE